MQFYKPERNLNFEIRTSTELGRLLSVFKLFNRAYKLHRWGRNNKE